MGNQDLLLETCFSKAHYAKPLPRSGDELVSTNRRSTNMRRGTALDKRGSWAGSDEQVFDGRLISFKGQVFEEQGSMNSVFDEHALDEHVLE